MCLLPKDLSHQSSVPGCWLGKVTAAGLPFQLERRKLVNIEFPGPIVPADDGGLTVRAVVDGATVACHFSMEVLQDVSPAFTAAGPMTQFEASRATLLSIAENKI